MPYGKTLVTADSGPTNVLSTATAKAHLRVEHSTEDTLIAAYVAAAVAHIEQQTNRQLLTATWDIDFDRFPVGGEAQLLPLAPLQSVDKIVYVASDGTSTTIGSGTIASDYVVLTGREPGLIAPESGKVWPFAADQPGSVTYRITSGYGETADIPTAVIQAVKLLVGHWYENREDVVIGTITASIPRGVQHLIETLTYDDLIDYRPRTRRVTHHGAHY